METTIEQVAAAIARGTRVLLLVRHAERPRISNEDRTFGASLPLTAAGERMSRDFGAKLRAAVRGADVQFRASPLRRTVMTAERIAEGMGIDPGPIATDARIGNAGAFVASERELWECFRDTKFFAHMQEYFRDGVQRGFNPLAAATDAYEDYVLSRFTAQTGIFTTHDVFVASFLHGRGVETHFSEANWPRFLDAAAIFPDADGARRYAFVRAGLSDRICGVDTGAAREPVVLASGSPRRAKILAAHGVAFTVVKTDAPEVSDSRDPVRTVRENARAKGAAAHARRVLSADTIVWCAGRIYGKPRDLSEAKEFLRALSGRTHTVFTGVAFDGDVRVVESRVTFRDLSEAVIDDYLARVNPLDRAGAYDIDASGEMLVAGYTGSYENIMGLPLEPLRDWGIL